MYIYISVCLHIQPTECRIAQAATLQPITWQGKPYPGLFVLNVSTNNAFRTLSNHPTLTNNQVGANVVGGVFDAIEGVTSWWLLQNFPQTSESIASVSSLSTPVKYGALVVALVGVAIGHCSSRNSRSKRE
jgi:hypothetical protein